VTEGVHYIYPVKYKPLILTLLLLACHKHNDNSTTISDLGKPYTLPVASVANPTYDASSAGIYKGVTVLGVPNIGTTLKINIANYSKAVYSLRYENGLLRDSLTRYTIDTMYPMVVLPLRANDSAIDPNKNIFTYFGSYRPDSALLHACYFRVNGDGSSPGFSVVTGEPTAILKERSNSQVYCYVGTWQGVYHGLARGIDSGRIAFVLNADTAAAVQLSTRYFEFMGPGGGRNSNGQVTVTLVDPSTDNLVITGTLSGNALTGTWQRTITRVMGTFTAQRTL
jgi:hypothetical protein